MLKKSNVLGIFISQKKLIISYNYVDIHGVNGKIIGRSYESIY